MRLSETFRAPRAAPRLVDVVWPHLGVLARRTVGPLLAAGGVLVDGTPGGINDPVAAGARLQVDLDRLDELAAAGRTIPPSPLAVPVLHADEHVVVVAKPAGMHVAPMGPHRDDTLVGAMVWRAGARPDQPWTAHRPTPAHRLDRPTAGLVLFALHHDAQAAVQAAMVAGDVRREYVAVVEGDVPGEVGTIEAPLGRDPADPRRRAVVPDGAAALTHWRVSDRATGRTTLRCVLGTGRTHQLRVHLASIGHPIVGDVDYGAVSRLTPTGLGPRIALTAVRLVFPHPVTGEDVEVEHEPDAPA